MQYKKLEDRSWKCREYPLENDEKYRLTPSYFQGCTRVGDYTVPQELIGGVYDMTYVTLDIVVHGEKEKC